MSAAERAAKTLCRSQWHGKVDYEALSDIAKAWYRDQIAALMADPVIVDLAIEAGWLVHARNYKYPQEGAYICGTFAGWVDDETDEDGRVADGFYAPLYRRREAPDA